MNRHLIFALILISEATTANGIQRYESTSHLLAWVRGEAVRCEGFARLIGSDESIAQESRMLYTP